MNSFLNTSPFSQFLNSFVSFQISKADIEMEFEMHDIHQRLTPMKERNDMQNRAEGEIELGADWSKSQPRQQEMWEAY